MLVPLIVLVAEAADGGMDTTQAAWAASLASEVSTLQDTEARRQRLARELSTTSDPERAARIGDALAVVLAAEEAETEVLRARLVLALTGESAPVAPPSRPSMEPDYRKRALEVRSAPDGTWDVYRIATGKAVSARTFVAMTEDPALYGRLRRARAFAYVGAGVLGGTALASASLGFLELTANGPYIPETGSFEEIPLAERLRAAAPYGALAAVCGVTAVVLPVATIRRQGDVHHYYDETRAREVVDDYDADLRHRYGMSATPRVDAALYVSLNGVGLRGTF